MPGVKGRSGPNRKPTKLRILEGNRSRTPIPDEVEPTGPAKRPRRFRFRGERASWDKLTPPLFAMGLATNADQEQLERMCYWHSQHIFFAYSVGDIKESERCYKQFERIASKFGMTPSDRAGLSVNQQPKQDEVERFLA